MLFRFPENLDEEAREEHAHFVLKFQQSTGPIMAKGLEDTAFYIYNRLAALNEVGGEPQHFGFSVEEFHRAQSRTPARLAGDVARHFDARHETERRCAGADGWRFRRCRNSGAAVSSAGASINRRWKRTLDDAAAPDANEEYLLYQTLLGTWPMEPSGEPSEAARREYIGRIQAYMAKALKEAKMNTSWIQPNEQWDAAMNDFVARVLEPSPQE